MISIAVLLAASAAQIDACEGAVRSDLASAATICALSKESVDLFEGSGPSTACIAALKAGQSAGKAGPALPAPMRNALIKTFDARLAECRFPAPKSDAPERETVNLWD